MGKRQSNILILVTAVFAAFTLGFFLGKNYNHSEVQISNLRTIEATIAKTETLQPSTEPTIAQPITEPPVTEAPAPETTAPATEAPVQTEPPAPAAEVADKSEDTSTSNGLININTASAAQLMTLPGIGEVLAQRIVDYRTANGPFQSIAALTNVKGIGEKRLAAIINLVTI